MLKLKKLKLSDISKYPFGRFKSNGDFSGELLREEYLIPYLGMYEHIDIDLNGVMGLGSSFLEEAFGGLAKKVSPEIIEDKISIICDEDIYTLQINEYIKANSKDD